MQHLMTSSLGEAGLCLLKCEERRYVSKDPSFSMEL